MSVSVAYDARMFAALPSWWPFEQILTYPPWDDPWPLEAFIVVGMTFFVAVASYFKYGFWGTIYYGSVLCIIWIGGLNRWPPVSTFVGAWIVPAVVILTGASVRDYLQTHKTPDGGTDWHRLRVLLYTRVVVGRRRKRVRFKRWQRHAQEIFERRFGRAKRSGSG